MSKFSHNTAANADNNARAMTIAWLFSNRQCQSFRMVFENSRAKITVQSQLLHVNICPNIYMISDISRKCSLNIKQLRLYWSQQFLRNLIVVTKVKNSCVYSPTLKYPF